MKVRFLLVLIQIVGIILSKSSIPYGVLVCGCLGYALCGASLSKKRIAILLAAFLPLLVGLYIEGPRLFDSAYRFQAYKIFMSEWWDHSVQVFGTGPGTFQILAPMVQSEREFMVGWHWLWMHSDWLQTVFELGFFGATLTLLVYFQILKKLYRSNEKGLFALACGLGSSAVVDYPARYMITAFLCALIAVLALRRD